MTDSQATRLQKGSIVVIATGGAPQEIVFQYNPASVRRSLSPRVVGGEPGGHSETVRFTGAPTETFSFQLELEGLAELSTKPQTQAAASKGVFPQLYALESLVYPELATMESAARSLALGTLEIAPAVTPLILIVWGPNRVAPVTITAIEVVEQIFDADLNPLRATVDVSARVLSYSDVTTTNPAYSRFVTYQQGKATLAKIAFSSS